jgi:hypothetical protein
MEFYKDLYEDESKKHLVSMKNEGWAIGCIKAALLNLDCGDEKTARKNLKEAIDSLYAKHVFGG